MDLVEQINADLPEGRRPITSISLPGDINRQVAEVLARAVPASEIGELIKTMMSATRQTKHGEEPEWRAREAAAKLWLAYQVGLPVQRQEIAQTITTRSEADNLRVLATPATLAAVKAMVQKAENVPRAAPEIPVEQC